MKTDTQLQQDVLAELDWNPAINAADIGVEVKDGIVTLSGHVGSFAEKWDAERAARLVGGVQALTIALDVNLLGSSKREDVDIARAVQNALLWSISVPSNDILVTVEAGHVTLAGEVKWTFQREAAVQAVRYLMGVTGVTDQIVITAHVRSATVKDQIEASLKRRAHQEASQIGVSVHGNEVTLTGVVPTWTDRNLACHAAWGTGGVHNVVDRMTYV
ncbi:MAG: BON domain-containing protein [Pseudomonadota bacterium]|nr:BON domain-containing protein [Pseudomonadota bacterium]